MIYAKVLFLFVGLWAVAVHPWMLPPIVAATLWLVLFTLLWVLLIRVASRSAAASVLRFSILAGSVWTVAAVAVGIALGYSGTVFLQYVFAAGLRAVRFGCAFGWAVSIMAWIRPNELYSLSWLPGSVRTFLLAFRVFVARSSIIVADLLDLLYSAGLPPGNALIRSIFVSSAPFPSHRLWSATLRSRLLVVCEAYFGIIVTYFDVLFSEEVPEVDAVYHSFHEE